MEAAAQMKTVAAIAWTSDLIIAGPFVTACVMQKDQRRPR
jgi:hypothetical protein